MTKSKVNEASEAASIKHNPAEKQGEKQTLEMNKKSEGTRKRLYAALSYSASPSSPTTSPSQVQRRSRSQTSSSGSFPTSQLHHHHVDSGIGTKKNAAPELKYPVPITAQSIPHRVPSTRCSSPMVDTISRHAESRPQQLHHKSTIGPGKIDAQPDFVIKIILDEPTVTLSWRLWGLRIGAAPISTPREPTPTLWIS